MGFASAALGAVSMVGGLVGNIMQGQAQAATANYQAQVARNNQIIAQQNASMALQQEEPAEEAQRIKTGSMIAGITAQEAASGINPNTGSAVNVRSSAAETGELDALTIKYNYGLQARNYLTQASNFGAQATLDTAQANWAAMNSILGAASSVSDKWLRYQMSGPFGVTSPGLLSNSRASYGATTVSGGIPVD